MTNTQFIRKAALNSKKVETKRRTISYEDLDYQKVEDKLCWLCGGETEYVGRPVSEAIKMTFTDHSRAKMQESESICRGCSFCLDNENRSLRNYSILATKEKLYHPGRDDWRKILIDPPGQPFIAIMAVSGQKHLHFKASISQSIDYYPALLEEREIIIIREVLEEILKYFETLYSNLFTKTEIRTGEYKQHRIMDFGIERWEVIESNISQWRPSGLLDVADYVAQEQEGLKFEKKEIEKECITTSKPTRKRKQLRLC